MKDRITYLLHRYYDNACSKEELDELFALIGKEDAEKQLETFLDDRYKELSRHNPSLTTVGEDGTLAKARSLWSEKTDIQERKFSRSKKWAYVAAASFLMLFTIAVLWDQYGPVRPETSTMSSVTSFTSVAQNKHLVLQDSTQIWLNAASSISYPEDFGSKDRVVFLTGEAFFDVKHAEDIPFIIHVGDVSIRVLGTSFNVKAYPDDQRVKVTVKRGKVQVSYKDEPLNTLTKGEEVVVNPSIPRLKEQHVVPYDIEKIGTWQSGLYYYDDTTLDEVLQDLERMFGCRIVLENEKMNDVLISTSFKRSDGLEQILTVITYLTDMTFENKGSNKYIIH